MTEKVNVITKHLMVIMVSSVLAAVLVVLASKEIRWCIGYLSLIGFAMMFMLAENKKHFLIAALLFGFSIQTSIFLWTPSATLHPHGAGPVTAPELYAFDLPLMILAIYVLFMKNRNRAHEFVKSDLAVLLMILFYALSIVKASNVLLGFSGLLFMLRMPIIYYCISRGLTSKEDVVLVGKTFLLLLIIQSMIGIAQTFGVNIPGMYSLVQTDRQALEQQIGNFTFSRPFGTIGYTTIFAQYLELLFTMPLVFYLYAKNKNEQWLYGMICFLAIACIIFTMSRILWFNVGVILILLIILVYNLKKQAIERASKMKMIFIVIAVVLFGLLFSERIAGRINLPDQGSAYARIQMARVAIKMIADNPLLGVGINNYTEKMYGYGLANELPGEISAVHNVFLFIGAETGLVALTLVLLMWYFAARRLLFAIKHTENTIMKISIGMFGGLVALFLHSNVEQGFHVHQQINGMLWVVFGTAAALKAMGIRTTSPGG